MIDELHIRCYCEELDRQLAQSVQEAAARRLATVQPLRSAVLAALRKTRTAGRFRRPMDPRGEPVAPMCPATRVRAATPVTDPRMLAYLSRTWGDCE